MYVQSELVDNSWDELNHTELYTWVSGNYRTELSTHNRTPGQGCILFTTRLVEILLWIYIWQVQQFKCNNYI